MDVNAAINILNEGKRIIGVRSTEFTLVDCPTMDDRLATDLKSSGRLKQERKTNFLLDFSIRWRRRKTCLQAVVCEA